MDSKIKLLGLAGALALLQATAAHASVTLDWSFTAFNGLSGSGAFTADQDPGNPANFNLISATGTIDGEAVTLSGYDGADNVAFPTSPVLIDTLGIGFESSSGKFYAIYEDFGNVGPAYACGGVSQPYCIEGPNAASDVGNGANVQALPTLSITLENAPVPEPAAWGLMLAGFGGLGAAMRLRRRMAVA